MDGHTKTAQDLDSNGPVKHLTMPLCFLSKNPRGRTFSSPQSTAVVGKKRRFHWTCKRGWVHASYCFVTLPGELLTVFRNVH